MAKEGKVVEVIGPVVDVEFSEGELPAIYNEIEIERGKQKISAEVALHIGDNKVRCISMEPTEGMTRGLKAIDKGSPISVPIGKETLGRVINVLGEPIDHLGPIKAKRKSRAQ